MGQPSASHLRDARRVGVQASWLTVAALALFPLLPGTHVVARGPFIALLVAAAAVIVIVSAVPERPSVTRTPRLATFYLWSAADVLLITLAIAFTGGASSELVYLYALPIFFLVTSYPSSAQRALLALIATSYLVAIAATGWNAQPRELLLRVGVLSMTAFLGRFLAAELRDRLDAYQSARQEADRRSDLLAVVANAGRDMATLDPQGVLDSVLRATGKLGLESSAVFVIDRQGDTYRTAAQIGFDGSDDQLPRPLANGLVGEVARRRQSLVMREQPGQSTPLVILERTAFRAAILTPVWAEEDVIAVLGGGTRSKRDFSRDEVEAFQLLGIHAGVALQNARRFEREHETAERLADLDQLKSDFVATASHELRTPLTVVRAAGELLDAHWDRLDDDRRRDFLRRINRHAQTLDDTVSRLLDFKRLETGSLEFHPERVGLRGMLEGVIDRAAHSAAGHTLSWSVGEGLLVVADPVLLDRVLENLVVNAAMHTPAGTRVSVRAFAEPPNVVIEVVDDGPGIPADELAKLGQRFVRGGDVETRGTRGLGLGLALASEVLRLHGTELEIESVPGRGSRFGFRLPHAAVREALESARDFVSVSISTDTATTATVAAHADDVAGTN